jgi:KDO2-lipid IV(A) lauroyltransferase
LRKLRYLIEYALALAGLRISRAAPRAFLLAAAKAAGAVVWLVPSIRKMTAANIKAVFPEKTPAEINRLGRESVAHLFFSLADFLHLAGRIDKVKKHGLIDERVMGLLRRCAGSGKGVIYVTPHLGSWEIAGLILTAHLPEIRLAAVARPIRNPYLNTLINNQARLAQLARIIPAKGAARGMIKALKESLFVATLIDQNTRVRDGGVFVRFMGLECPCSAAPAMLSRKLKIPAVVAGVYRKGLDYHGYFEELPKNPEDYASDQEMTADLMKITERMVREHPEQYLWMYKRFQNIPKDAPPGAESRYPYYARRADEKFYSKQEKFRLLAGKNG